MQCLQAIWANDNIILFRVHFWKKMVLINYEKISELHFCPSFFNYTNNYTIILLQYNVTA